MERRELYANEIGLHADDMARGVGALAGDVVLEAFHGFGDRPVPLPAAWTLVEIPVLLPQFPPYLLQCLHCIPYT